MSIKSHLNYSKTCGDSGWRKDSNKIAYKNAEKVRFYKGLTHFQKDKDCQDQLRKIRQKITKNLQLPRFA